MGRLIQANRNSTSAQIIPVSQQWCALLLTMCIPLLPQSSLYPNGYFQQDIVRCFSQSMLHLKRACILNMTVTSVFLQWPAQSPDLNATEDLWDEVKQEVGSMNVWPKELCDAIGPAKTKIPKEHLQHHFESITWRIQEGIWSYPVLDRHTNCNKVANLCIGNSNSLYGGTSKGIARNEGTESTTWGGEPHEAWMCVCVCVCVVCVNRGDIGTIIPV